MHEKHPLFALLEPASFYDDNANLEVMQGLHTRTSLAISAKRVADALELIAQHLAPVNVLADASTVVSDGPRWRRRGEVEFGSWSVMSLYTPIEVEFAPGVFPGYNEKMPLGDAVEWSVLVPGTSMPKNLKASIVAWRPL